MMLDFAICTLHLHTLVTPGAVGAGPCACLGLGSICRVHGVALLAAMPLDVLWLRKAGNTTCNGAQMLKTLSSAGTRLLFSWGLDHYSKDPTGFSPSGYACVTTWAAVIALSVLGGSSRFHTERRRQLGASLTCKDRGTVYGPRWFVALTEAYVQSSSHARDSSQRGKIQPLLCLVDLAAFPVFVVVFGIVPETTLLFGRLVGVDGAIIPLVDNYNAAGGAAPILTGELVKALHLRLDLIPCYNVTRRPDWKRRLKKSPQRAAAVGLWAEPVVASGYTRPVPAQITAQSVEPTKFKP